jgi:hypothetical protein
MAEALIQHQATGFWNSPIAKDGLGAILAGATMPVRSTDLRTACSLILADRNKRYETLTPLEKNELCLQLRRLMNLIRCWRQAMAAQYGSDFWRQARDLFQDGKTLVWLKLIQEVAQGHSQDALDGLEDLGRVGIKWQLVGGREKKETCPDFGLSYLWLMTDRIEQELRRQRKQGGQSHIFGIVRMEEHGRGQRECLYLSFKGRKTKLSPKESQLVKYLKREGNSAPDEILCKEFWPTAKSIARNWDRGALNNLKTLVCEINGKLNLQLQRLPEGERWLRRSDNSQYELTTRVRWDYGLDKEFGTSKSRPMDPLVLSQLVADRGGPFKDD